MAVIGAVTLAVCGLAGSALGADTATVPGAPAITSISPGDHSARIHFSKPANDGGAPIFTYRATCVSSDGGATRSESSSSLFIVVDNLTAAHTYTCTVSARNRVGFGPASAPSAAIVAQPVLPGVVTITSVIAMDHGIRVTFSQPSSSGGSPIFTYKATCVSSNGGRTGSDSQFSRSFVVENLTPGKTYTCTVMARNIVGFGPPSAPSAPVVVLPLITGSPTITGATPGVESISLAFSPPTAATDIRDYHATCVSSDGGVTRSRDNGGSPIVVTDLTTAKTYTCTIMAENSLGFGAPSAPSAPLMTLAPPGAPTIGSVTAGSRSVSVLFSAPAADGGTAIFDYRALCASSDGGVTRWVDGGGAPIVVTGLTPGNTYTCIASAKNAVGFGPPSAPSAAVVTLP